jgi:outer membrane protein assembly factor BamB
MTGTILTTARGIALTSVCLGAALLVLASLSTSSVMTNASSVHSISAPGTPDRSSSANAAAGSGDWPTYLQNPSRTSANLAETTLSTANAKSLKTLWTYETSDVISGSTTVVGNMAYVGSWNGDEYAFDAATGVLEWSTDLGIAQSPSCGTQGIASSATVENGSLYIGGGDGYWYALNATTGQVEWKVLVGNPSAGYYNWASPLLYDGFAYVGIASFCDMPLVPGGLLQVNLSSHLIQNEFHTTPTGGLGSSVWGSPSVDAKTNTVYFATGNAKTGETGQLADAVVAVNATTMKLVSSWILPPAQQIVDGDFGSSATLFQTSTGTTMMGALNKNGYFYAFNAANLAAGPVWKYKVTTGQSVGSASFGQGLVYVAAGAATYKGVHSSGAAWALNAATGAVVWEQPLWGKSVSAPAYANGLLLVDGGKHVFVLNAATGAKLKELACGSTFYSPPAISHGVIYVGCTSGQEFAFGIPDPITPPASLEPSVSFEGVPALAAISGLPRWV